MEKIVKELAFRSLRPEIKLTSEEQKEYDRLREEFKKLPWEKSMLVDEKIIREQQNEITNQAENRLRRQLGLSPKDEADKLLSDYLELK